MAEKVGNHAVFLFGGEAATGGTCVASWGFDGGVTLGTKSSTEISLNP